MKIVHGKEYFIWQMHHGQNKECLAMTNLELCDHCNSPATVNSVWVTGGATPQMFNQADKIKLKYGELTELGADSDGNCFCENCYSKHAVLD